MGSRTSSLRLEIRSLFDMLDFVQLVVERLSQIGGFDEDSMHWIDVAVRESVINAIKHGNREDSAKLVTVEFSFVPEAAPKALMVRVVDQGEGFDLDAIADPLAPENMLKSSGRGIFFMRAFMDELTVERSPQGGMEVRMIKAFPGDRSNASNGTLP